MKNYPEEVLEKTAYMCGIDWQHECGESDCQLFATPEECARVKKCTDQCGIVEVKVTVVRWVKPQNLHS